MTQIDAQTSEVILNYPDIFAWSAWFHQSTQFTWMENQFEYFCGYEQDRATLENWRENNRKIDTISNWKKVSLWNTVQYKTPDLAKFFQELALSIYSQSLAHQTWSCSLKNFHRVCDFPLSAGSLIPKQKFQNLVLLPIEKYVKRSCDFSLKEHYKYINL